MGLTHFLLFIHSQDIENPVNDFIEVPPGLLPMHSMVFFARKHQEQYIKVSWPCESTALAFYRRCITNCSYCENYNLQYAIANDKVWKRHMCACHKWLCQINNTLLTLWILCKDELEDVVDTTASLEHFPNVNPRLRHSLNDFSSHPFFVVPLRQEKLQRKFFVCGELLRYLYLFAFSCT